jgi:hypothetical protein
VRWLRLASMPCPITLGALLNHYLQSLPSVGREQSRSPESRCAAQRQRAPLDRPPSHSRSPADRRSTWLFGRPTRVARDHRPPLHTAAQAADSVGSSGRTCASLATTDRHSTQLLSQPTRPLATTDHHSTRLLGGRQGRPRSSIAAPRGCSGGLRAGPDRAWRSPRSSPHRYHQWVVQASSIAW